MTSRSSNFTPDAQHVFTMAEAEARALNHGYIGQEHLLLGLLELTEGGMPTVWERLGADRASVREAITTVIKPGSTASEGEIGFTPRLKRAVQLAEDEARAEWAVQLAIGKATAEEQPLTSSVHLLCGLLLEGTGVGAGALQSFGVTVEQVRAFISPRSAVAVGIKEAFTQIADRDRGLKRYLLTMPADLFEEVQAVAERQQTNVAELLRRFTRLGLLATRIQETPGAALLIREGNSEQRLVLL